MVRHAVAIAALALAAGCASPPEETRPMTTYHADLVSAGLGLAGLIGPAPMPADPEAPTHEELRRLAYYGNWRSIADLSEWPRRHGDLPFIAGHETHAFLRLPDRRQPFRVMLHVPESFDRANACLLVVPVSGSRGVYGSVALGGPWGLVRGCAVVYTDKGAGTDFFEHAGLTGNTLDGRVAVKGDAQLGFEPERIDHPLPLVAMRHAHSGDHPEADWGLHTIEAARFALRALGLPRARVRIVAVGLSNGGGAVLRAVEQDTEGLFDAAIAVAPNVTARGARTLFDYATEAALLQPCLFASYDPRGQARCDALAEQGLLQDATPTAAFQKLMQSGFEQKALETAGINVSLDLWRSVGAIYASAYLRRDAYNMPCGYGMAIVGEDGNPRMATSAERAIWWATSPGVAPAVGISLLDASGSGGDPSLGGLRCLRELWTGNSVEAAQLRAAVEQTRHSAQLPNIPVLVIHGAADGLVPVAFSSRPYVEAARAAGATQLAYWELEQAQHFDAMLAAPGMRVYRPLMPYAFAGLDQVFALLDGDGELSEVAPDLQP